MLTEAKKGKCESVWRLGPTWQYVPSLSVMVVEDSSVINGKLKVLWKLSIRHLSFNKLNDTVIHG